MTLLYSNMTVSLCIRQESQRNDDSVSVEELDWSAERQVLIPGEHLWCDFKWAKNSSPNTNDLYIWAQSFQNCFNRGGNTIFNEFFKWKIKKINGRFNFIATLAHIYKGCQYLYCIRYVFFKSYVTINGLQCICCISCTFFPQTTAYKPHLEWNQ